MAAKLASVDIAEVHSLRELVEEVRRDGVPRLLRSENEDIALLLPVTPTTRQRRRRKTADDYDAFRASAGGWKGIVDVDQFKRDNTASRKVSTRPTIEL